MTKIVHTLSFYNCKNDDEPDVLILIPKFSSTSDYNINDNGWEHDAEPVVKFLKKHFCTSTCNLIANKLKQ
jgi:hypothetical protein